MELVSAEESMIISSRVTENEFHSEIFKQHWATQSHLSRSKEFQLSCWCTMSTLTVHKLLYITLIGNGLSQIKTI